MTTKSSLTEALGRFVALLSPNRLAEEAARIMADGRTVESQPVSRATGHPWRPLTDQQLYDKFANCLDVGGSPIPADGLFRRLSARDITAAASRA